MAQPFRRPEQNKNNPQSRPPPKQPPQQQQPPQKPNNQKKPQTQTRRPLQKGKRPLLKRVIRKITGVQIEGLVLLKIIKHCGEYLSQRQAVSGKLLGLPTGKNTVEITNCFPEPNTPFAPDSDEINDKAKAKAHKKADGYARDMIRLMSRIREDNLTVGFYRSALNGAFLSAQTIDALFRHQRESSTSVCIIYDPNASIRGRLVVRAFRLRDSFMKFYALQSFGASHIAQQDDMDIFQELDVKIHNSHLVHAFLYEIAQLKSFRGNGGFARLHHSHERSLQTNLQQLSASIDDYAEQTQQFRSYYGKSLKNKNKREAFITKFNEENKKLRSRGQKPRPMPETAKMFPAEEEPERFESVTLTAQMNEYCQEVETNIMQALVKLWVTQGIHSKNVIQ